MSDLKYTPTQERAISQTLDINVSVSAGAGSGKTRVLVDRFIKLIAVGKAQADEILAITFTRKAAKEMRERVRSSLLARLDAAVDEEKLKWQQELSLLEKAQITTIDSFCHKVLRENPVECSMDPNFTVNQEFELDEFTSEVIADFLTDKINKEDKDVLLLLENYTPRQLSTMMFALTEDLDAILESKNLAEPYATKLGNEGELQAQVLAAFKALIDTPDVTGAKTIEKLAMLKEQEPVFLKLLRAGDYVALNSFGKMLTSTKKIKTQLEDFREALDEIKSLGLDKQALPVISAWDKVLRSYRQTLTAAADIKELYSFDAIAVKAVKVLESFPEILDRYREKYKFIMVDEFQDTNQLQKNLVYLLAGGREDTLAGNRLFVVGDAKQSIYRFRGADVSVFKQVRDAIAASGGENIVMADNFRSREAIINACNCLFRDLLTKDGTADVTAQDLVPHREKGPKPTIFTVEIEDKNTNSGNLAEAMLAAKTIKKIVAEDNTLSYSDVAVLLPSIGLGGRFAAAFGQLGIPYTILDGKGFYERQENIDIINLLAFLLNSRKDYCLAGILRSPYFAIPDTTLTKLFQGKESHTLWETLAVSQEPLCVKAAGKITELQKAVKGVGLGEFFTAIYEILKVEPLLLGQDFGKEKLANVNKLRKLAVDFALEQGASPLDFIQRYENLRAVEAREGAAVIQDTEETVSIMTIHKSKGLEFPVVYLPALQSRGRNDASGIIFRPEIGLGIKVLDNSSVLSETSIYRAAKEENNKLEDSEKIRQLYVAMTRAKDYLFLSSVKNITGKRSKDTKENWFTSLERVFNQESENSRFVNWENYSAGDLAAEHIESPAAKTFTVPQETFKRIEPLAIGSKETVFSATALQEYDLCPRRYYYNYVKQMPTKDPEVMGAGNYQVAPYLLGLAIHKALELSKLMPLNEAITKAVAQQMVSPAQEKTLGKIATALLQKYCVSSLYLANKDLTSEAEREFSLSLFRLDDEEIYFTGSIDSLLHYPDGSLGIVDYKTGRPPEQGEEKQGYQRQLLIYTLAAEKIFNKKVTSAQLHFLQNCSAQDLLGDKKKGKVQLKELINEIRNKKNEQDFPVLSTGCKYCPYSFFCKKV
ncbi:MAG: UvrD-helicase domain-containing protein [Acidaminococcaceae bacterium]|jgi:ATP-dependent helicase/nuclease subunit A|nr:UvrD-helicase domain-containing protein [Acidaminococcaceae bacterium]